MSSPIPVWVGSIISGSGASGISFISCPGQFIGIHSKNIMRCYYCDFCPTAPSLSSPNERTFVKLYWDEELKGWHCKSSCDEAEEGYSEESYSVGTIATSKAPVSE